MSALLTDVHQLHMVQSCLDEDRLAPAVFELCVRRLPAQRGFLVAAGLEQALQFLKSLSFSEAEYAWLRDDGGFSPSMLEYVRALRFDGDVEAMPEGTVFFADEPILRVTAALPQLLLVESRLQSLIHFETSVASTAARMVQAGAGRRLAEVGLRQAHGAEAALLAARAAYLAGFDSTATADACRRFGVPAIEAAGRLLVQPREGDSPTEVAALARAAGERARHERRVAAVCLSGPACVHAGEVRRQLDAAGLGHVTIRACGPLDEHAIDALVRSGAPIDGFAADPGAAGLADPERIEARFTERADAGTGATQVCRHHGADGLFVRDTVRLGTEADAGEPLLQPCLRRGRRVGQAPTLAQARAHHARQVSRVPSRWRQLEPADPPYPVEMSAGVRALAPLPG